MVIKIILTQSGMGIEEGKVVRWLKAVGDRVERGELVAEVETAKAVQDIEAPATGVLSKIVIQEGETAPVNAELGEIEEN